MLAREASAFPGGAVAVDLAPLRQPALVIPRIAAALGLPEAADADPVEALARHLRGLRVLLVLDNLEQLPGAAPVLADLVARCPDLVVLATSRAPLRVRAEHEVVLSPLATPTADDVETVVGSPAVALLLDRAAAAGAPIQATDDDAAALAAITRQLDGLPLALELAAPGLRLLSPTTLLKRLTQTEIGTGPRDLPERHRTMTAVLDWSMDLLEPEEVDLFERLAVFSDGFFLDAVEAVAAPEGPDDERADVLPALGTLVEQSLVLRVPSPDDQPRFRLLEPVRQYAMQRLHASGQATATADRHAAHFLARATASLNLLEGPELVSTLDRLEADHANLRSAYLRLLELDRDGDAAELAGSLWLYLALRGHAREGLEWLEQIGPGASDAARCRGLNGRLGLLFFTGDIEQMRREAEAALAVAGRVADPAVTCETLLIAGYAAVFTGDLEAAEELLARGLAQAVDAGRQWVVVQGRFAQAQIALTAGDLTSAGTLVPEVVSAAREARERVQPGDVPEPARDASPSWWATSRRRRRCLTSHWNCRSTAGSAGRSCTGSRRWVGWRCGWATRHPRPGCSARPRSSPRPMPPTRASRCRARCPTAGSRPPAWPSTSRSSPVSGTWGGWPRLPRSRRWPPRSRAAQALDVALELPRADGAHQQPDRRRQGAEHQRPLVGVDVLEQEPEHDRLLAGAHRLLAVLGPSGSTRRR